jgi:hypothetical protein
MGGGEEAKKLKEDMEVNDNGIVEVNPKPSKGFTSKAIDLLEKLIVKLMYDSSQPLHYLSGNFAPVKDETPPCKDLPVQGHLPVRTLFILLFFFLLFLPLSIVLYQFYCLFALS